MGLINRAAAKIVLLYDGNYASGLLDRDFFLSPCLASIRICLFESRGQLLKRLDLVSSFLSNAFVRNNSL